MKELIEYIAKSLASKPEDVVVSEEINDEGQVVIKLQVADEDKGCLLYTSPSPRDGLLSRMPSSA